MKLWKQAGGALQLILVVILGLAPWQTAQASGSAQSRHVCSHRPKAGWVRCHAAVATDAAGQPLISGVPNGYGPADFHGAYHTGSLTSRPMTVAVVGAYDAPRIKADLDTYNRTYGLASFPECSAKGQVGCFTKLDQHGGRNYPKPDAGWALETSMDVEIVHAMCQNCRLLLVEANTASLDDLSAAVDQAVAQGAQVVSNSYGGPEWGAETSYDAHYHHTGVAILVSSGDSGYGTSYPATSPYVVAVGGTSLRWNGSAVISETAWSKAGSGCSQFESKPSWQHDPVCDRRSIADVSADADPTTGAAIYDSYATNGRSGWFTVGGTSLSAPLVAGMIGVSGGLSGTGASSIYTHAGRLRDITTGKNGRCGSYLCLSAAGYDGPTGFGVPNGSL